MTVDCRHARVAIGGDPHDLPAEIRSHLAGCPDCSRFAEETQKLDLRLRDALNLPVNRFRRAASPPARRFALAASVMLAILIGGGVWLLRPQSALAGELVDHIRHDRRSASRHLRLIDSRCELESSAWRTSDEREAIDQALATLLPDQRLALTLRYLDQLPVREMASLLHRSESATESVLSRAREAFRLAYEGHSDA